MSDLILAAQVATMVSAITSSIQLGISYNQASSRISKNTINRHAKILVSTYDDEELKSLHDRIKACKDRFVLEGDGEQRVKCICSVLNDAIVGNGGASPIPEWQNMHNKLC